MRDRKFPNPKLTLAGSGLQNKMHYWIDLHQHLPMAEIVYGNYKGFDGMVLRIRDKLRLCVVCQLVFSYKL